jgi:hypothetical protein
MLHFSPSIMPWLVVSTVLWLSMFALSGAINSGGGSSTGIRRVWDVTAAVLLAFVSSAVAIGVQVVALIKGNPHRFEVIQKTDPKERKPSLITTTDRGSPDEPEPVVQIPEPVAPEPVETLPDLSQNIVDGR